MITLKPSGNLTTDTDALAAALKKLGPTGVIYFSPGLYSIDGTQIKFPAQPYSGWLSLLLDGTINLVGGPLKPQLNTVIEGRMGDPQGLGGSFVFDRYASIQVSKSNPKFFPCVELAGAQAVVLRSLNLTVDGPSMAMHLHDLNGAGCVWNKIESCVIYSSDPGSSSILIDTSAPNIGAGFGLLIKELSTGSNSPTKYALEVYNFGGIKMTDSFIGNNGIFMQNLGAPQMGNCTFDNILTENFYDGCSFLTVRGNPPATGGWFRDITLRQVGMADNKGAAYLVDAAAYGAPPKYSLLGLRLEGCVDYTAILNPANPLGAANISGFDGYGNQIWLNPAS